MQSLDKLTQSIAEGSGKSPEEVKKLITEKEEELSGLVSAEGAAYIVGRELGVSLLKETERQLKVKNLISGLRAVDLAVRVAEVQDVREFTRNGKTGQVMNLIVGDETGTVRFSFWNDEVEKAKQYKQGDVLKVTKGWVKVDNRGNPELRLGKGTIEKVSEDIRLPDKLPEPRDLQAASVAQRTTIDKLKEGDFGEIRACMVQVFHRKKPFYEVCPECGKRVVSKDGKWSCNDHGEVSPDFSMVVSGVLDDGTGSIRAVFFRDIAEKLFNKTAKELRDLAQKEMNAIVIYENLDCLGKDMLFKGRVKKNDLSESIELVVNDMQDFDVKKEAQELAGSLDSAS
jgi:replication factor A1